MLPMRSNASEPKGMLLQVVAGLFIGSINVVIHAWLTDATFRVARAAAVKRRTHPWRLTAMNGVLLFGWSTAVIFEVLRKTVSLQTSFVVVVSG
jgi:hypothetical protein